MQAADEKPFFFSYLTKKINAKQISCGMTYTNDKVHKIIEKNLKLVQCILDRLKVLALDTALP